MPISGRPVDVHRDFGLTQYRTDGQIFNGTRRKGALENAALRLSGKGDCNAQRIQKRCHGE